LEFNRFLTAKRSGGFTLAFSDPAPEGDGSLDWEVIPRSGSHSAVAIAERGTPTATPTPKSLVQQWREGQGPWQQCANLIRANPIPGPHTVSIIATESSHDFATGVLSCLKNVAGWNAVEHGQPNAFIGYPSEYALDNGITIRARVDSVDAETLRLIFMVVGFSVNRVVLPSTDNRTYPILEIGNLPQ
jgi:hypothetical protein